MPSTHNNVWAQNEPAEVSHDVTLPSGQTCAAKKVGIEGLLEMGILAQADALTAMVTKHTRQVKGGKGPDGTTVDEASLMADPDSIKAIISLADSALPIIVDSPPVALHYSTTKVGKTTVTKKLTAEDRQKLREKRNQPDLVFTDQVGFEDKMFLFDWAVGGLKSFMSFRGGPSDGVGGVAPSTGPARPAKRTAGRKR